MIVVGVTGGLGSGKTTVARMLAARGAKVLDADRIAHGLMRPRTEAWRAIVKAFGRATLTSRGAINRAALAQRVFRDARARRTLEQVLHPRVMRAIKRELNQWARRRVPVAVLDVPLLIEAGMASMVDVLVVVTAPASVRRKRLEQRGYTQEEISRRAAAQMALSEKAKMADVVIDNGKSRVHTRQQVEALWKHLKM